MTSDGGYLMPGLCEKGKLYFMSSLVEWDTGADRAGLFIGCFLRADNSTGTIGTEVCAPPLLLDDIATLFTPEGVEHGKLPRNQPTQCGFNFIPYKLIDETQSRFGGLESTSFDIEWSQSSYLSQKDVAGVGVERADGRELDYKLVEKSLKPMPVIGKQTGAMWVNPLAPTPAPAHE